MKQAPLFPRVKVGAYDRQNVEQAKRIMDHPEKFGVDGLQVEWARMVLEKERDGKH